VASYGYTLSISVIVWRLAYIRFFYAQLTGFRCLWFISRRIFFKG